MWTTLFWLTNAIAAFGWLLVLFGRRSPLANSAVLYLGVALPCLIYALCIVAVIILGRNGGLSPEASGTSIAGIKAFFATDGGAVIGWTHYLAFDLFTGIWIARDADHKGFSRLWQAPFLILTYLFGPIGLLGWLTFRERRARLSGRG